MYIARGIHPNILKPQRGDMWKENWATTRVAPTDNTLLSKKDNYDNVVGNNDYCCSRRTS